ncbi:MAG TPA: squalene/phytoene synthase family protein [Anaerolineales bacterium]
MSNDIALQKLGTAITRAASLQTYTTVRLLVDRDRVQDAYQAYAYFRWVDDWLDEPRRQRSERLAFARRQSALIDACYRGDPVETCTMQEEMLVGLVQGDTEADSGLQSYIRNMMFVMTFDAERRGRLISAEELQRYEVSLATAVTEALHFFIGHGCFSPHGPTRYLAVEGAHITHMLRDAVEDNELGYFNIPREFLRAKGISPSDIESRAYRSWVRSRVQLARRHFEAGRTYLSQVRSLRCRLAGYAYVARFETVLDSIERDGYVLRRDYSEAKSPRAGAGIGLSVLWSAFHHSPAAQSGAWSVRSS